MEAPLQQLSKCALARPPKRKKANLNITPFFKLCFTLGHRGLLYICFWTSLPHASPPPPASRLLFTNLALNDV